MSETLTTCVLNDTVTAEGNLKGKSLRTVVNAIEFDADHGLFTATRIDQGRVNATAYNAPEGAGTHFGLSAHGVLTAEITQSSYGPRITMFCEDGQMVTIDLFGVRNDDGTFAALPITFA